MRSASLAGLAATLLLGGCLATSPLAPGGGAAATAAPEAAPATRLATGSSVLGFGSSPQPGAAASPLASVRSVGQLFDLQKAELDLMRPDGAACRAVADGGFVSNLALMAQIAATLTVDKFLSGSRHDRAALQRTLDQVRPQLRQLSKQVVWLPLDAEVAIGRELARLSGSRDWRPAAKSQRAFVDGPLQRSFETLRRYAVDELKSPLNFQLRLIRDDGQPSAEMLPGGTVIVTSALVAALAGQDDAEQTIAFMLAHEFSHALRRHTTKTAQERLIDGLTAVDVFVRLFKGTGQQLTGLAPGQLAQMFNLSAQGIGQAIGAVCTTQKWFSEFDQAQELEADTCGALLLDKLALSANRSFDPVAGLRRYRALTGGGGGARPPAGAGPCVQFASHPPAEAREINLRVYWGRIAERRGGRRGAGAAD